MAPEQAEFIDAPLSERTDVFGLGAVFYTLLTGQPPWHGTCSAEALSHLRSGHPLVPPAELNPELPTWMSDLSMKCLARIPEQRIGSMEELKRAISAGQGLVDV